MAGRGDGLRDELTMFVRHHPRGWDHSEWESLLTHLADEGHDVTDPDAIGIDLERARVLEILAGLPLSGLGPKRREALAGMFPRAWELEHASPADLAAVSVVSERLAQSIHGALHS